MPRSPGAQALLDSLDDPDLEDIDDVPRIARGDRRRPGPAPILPEDHPTLRVRIPQRLLDLLDEVAAKEGRTRSGQVRYMIQNLR